MDANSIEIFNEDGLAMMRRLAAQSVDLIVADPPYGLGKDYGNESDSMEKVAYVRWLQEWAAIAHDKLKESGLVYIFQSWQRAPEVFSMLKRRFTMVNEIIWDRRVPSMGGTTRRFTSVHDNIGVFAKSPKYFFDLDPVRVPYDEETKKARSRSIFVGSKWLEMGCNPKDVWSISRLHAIHRERENHPTQKPRQLVDRIVLSSSPVGGLVVDPFGGTGTTAESCLELGRFCKTAELNLGYVELMRARIGRGRSRKLGKLDVDVDGTPTSPAMHSAGLGSAQLDDFASTGVDENKVPLVVSRPAKVAVISAEMVLGLIISAPRSSDEISQIIGVDRAPVAKALFELKCANRIESVGRGRGTKYRAKTVLRAEFAPQRGANFGLGVLVATDL